MVTFENREKIEILSCLEEFVIAFPNAIYRKLTLLSSASTPTFPPEVDSRER